MTSVFNGNLARFSSNNLCDFSGQKNETIAQVDNFKRKRPNRREKGNNTWFFFALSVFKKTIEMSLIDIYATIIFKLTQFSKCLSSDKISFTACGFLSLNNRLVTSVRMKIIYGMLVQLQHGSSILINFRLQMLHWRISWLS